MSTPTATSAAPPAVAAAADPRQPQPQPTVLLQPSADARATALAIAYDVVRRFGSAQAKGRPGDPGYQVELARHLGQMAAEMLRPLGS